MNQTMERKRNRQIRALYVSAAARAVEKSETVIKRLAEWKPNPLLGQLTAEELQRERIRHLVRLERETNFVNEIVGEMATAGRLATEVIDNSNSEIYQNQHNTTARNIGKQAGVAVGATALLTKPQAKTSLAREPRSRYQAVSRRRLTGTNAKTRGRATKRIRKIVLVGVERGQSIPQIMAAVRAAFLTGSNMMSAYDATRIARTEAIRILNQAAASAAEQMANAHDLVLRKRWLSTFDERTRDAHEHMNGVVVGQHEKFITALGELMFPGDPNGTPENVIHCRCSHAYIVVFAGGRYVG